MAYKTSTPALKMLRRILSAGKPEALIQPDYKPPLQRVFDSLVLLSALAIPILIWQEHTPEALALLPIIAVLWLIREFFVQDDHALVRIYGPFGRMRYLFETQFRDKYLQYFNESNTDGRPIPRIVRDYVYQKAHKVKSIASFGTELDTFDPETTSGVRILHRNFPGTISGSSYGYLIGEHRKNVRPFRVRNTLNISAMSYGSINYRSAEALGLGARDVAYVNTGEGGFGPHGVGGGDVIFQIGTGKFGVGQTAHLPDGTETRILNEQLLTELVREHSNIGMIQLKISQGAKPGMGGHLPGSKVTEEIAAVRKVPIGKPVISPPVHAECIAATPKESVLRLMDLIDRVRSLTELPVGIKFCVGRPDEIDLLVDAMKATGKGPDAIQIDGADGGTGAGHNLFLNYVGYGSSAEGGAYLDLRLKKAGLRDQVRISASGKFFTPAHAALAFAVGADTIDTARGAMLALGCIQSLKCHTNHCPTGITTNSPWRTHGINIPEKASRIHHYLVGFHMDLMELARVTGHSDPRDLRPDDLRCITEEATLAAHFNMDPKGLHMPLHRFWQD